MSPKYLAIWAYFWPLRRISGSSVAKPEPDIVKSEQTEGFESQTETVKSEAEGLESQLENVKFEPEGFESQPETCKTKPECFELEPEVVKFEPEVERTRLDASTQCKEM